MGLDITVNVTVADVRDALKYIKKVKHPEVAMKLLSDAAVSQRLTQLQTTIDPDGKGVRVVRLIVVPELMDITFSEPLGKKPEGYADIANLDEDKRIDLIGKTVIKGNRTVAFVTDDEPGKRERYIQKLQQQFPGIRIIEWMPGPVANTVAVKVAPPDVKAN